MSAATEPQRPLVLDEHEVAWLAHDGGLRLDVLAGVVEVTAVLGDPDRGRRSLEERELLTAGDPAVAEGALGVVVATLADASLAVAVHERRPPVPTTRIGVRGGGVGLVMAPGAAATWDPAAGPGGRSAGTGGATQDEAPKRRAAFQLDVRPVEPGDLVEEVLGSTWLAGPLAEPPAPVAAMPAEAWAVAVGAAGRGDLAGAVLQMRAAGVDRTTAGALAAAAQGVGGGGAAVVHWWEGSVAHQADVGWFTGRSPDDPWLWTDLVDERTVQVSVASRAAVAAGVRALLEGGAA